MYIIIRESYKTEKDVKINTARLEETHFFEYLIES